MPVARFQMPDGRIGRFEVPEGTTPEQAQAMIAKSLDPQEAETSLMQHVGNLAAGAVRGAGSIGATVLSPIDAAARALNGGKPISVGGIDIAGQDRRGAIDAGLQTMGAQPDSMMYQGGKLGVEVAGTAGAGGMIARGALAVPALARFAPVLESGGFSLSNAAKVTQKGAPALTKLGNTLSNAAMRASGGAIVGAASAGMVNPDDAVTGALIGGIAPGAVKVAGATGKALKNGAGKIVSGTIGATTGVGGAAVSEAFKAGKSGTTAFLENMRGDVPMADVLQQAKDGLSKIRMQRGAEYRSGMAQVSSDKTVLDFKPIQDAIDSLKSMGSYKGQVINKNASGTVDEIANQVSTWAKLNPSEYHTPEGFDALKQAIGDIRDSAQFGTPARKAADTVYNAIKTQITDQAPVYSKVMRGYQEASDTINEIQKALSIGNKASADTGMRKLQSLMRNNVNTNFGNRLDLVKQLKDQSGVDIIPAVAGQSMNAMSPRGMIGVGEKGGAVMSALLNPSSIPALIAAAPLASPRLMGEAAYKLGQVSGAPGKAYGLLAQRLPELKNAANSQGLLDLMRTAPLLYGVNQVNQAAQR